MTLNSLLFHYLSMVEIKFIDPNANFMGFHFFKTMYTQLHLEEISFLSPSSYIIYHIIKNSYVTLIY
jgi:hypothetical protein